MLTWTIFIEPRIRWAFSNSLEMWLLFFKKKLYTSIWIRWKIVHTAWKCDWFTLWLIRNRGLAFNLLTVPILFTWTKKKWEKYSKPFFVHFKLSHPRDIIQKSISSYIYITKMSVRIFRKIQWRDSNAANHRSITFWMCDLQKLFTELMRIAAFSSASGKKSSDFVNHRCQHNTTQNERCSFRNVTCHSWKIHSP